VFILLIVATACGYRNYIMPEDQDFMKCPSQPCATLDHFLFNSTLFNISNSEFYFLPGNHYLNANMVISSVCNISLIGVNKNNSSLPVVLCSSDDVSIAITFSDNIIVSNLVFKECGGFHFIEYGSKRSDNYIF